MGTRVNEPDSFWAALGLPPPIGDHVLATNARRRDEFARAALAMLDGSYNIADIHVRAFDVADAMLAEADRRLLRDIAAFKEKSQ